MSTKLWAIGLMLFSTVLISFGQYFVKKGVDVFSMSSPVNFPLSLGILFYIVGGFLVLIAMKGGEVSVLFPIIATSYVWVALLAFYFLNETIIPLEWVGIGLVILGVTFIGFGGVKKVKRDGGKKKWRQSQPGQ